MSYDITCRGCGHRNPMGRLYCMACGARLEVNEQTVSAAGARAGRGSGLRMLRLGVVLLLLVALVQMVRPVAPGAEVGARAQAGNVEAKVEALQAALMESRARQETFAEPELNAYLVELLAGHAGPSATWLGFEVRRVQVALTPGQAVLLVEAARGSLVLTQEITAEPVRTPQGWQFEVTGLRVGHLPLPRPLANMVAVRSARLLAGLTREREVFQRLSGFRISRGSVEAVTSGS